MGIYAPPGPFEGLKAPLELPAVPGGELTTEGGVTVDNGYGAFEAVHLLVRGWTPTLPANPPVSGTVYQNTSGGPEYIIIPVTATAVGGSAQLALGPTSSPPDWGGPEDIGVSGETHNVSFFVPQLWYWSLTVTNATIGTGSVLGQ